MVALGEEKLNLIGVQQSLLDECMRSILYYRKIEMLPKKAVSWRFIKGVLLRHSIIQWCQIFGNRGEDAHWSRLADSQDIIEVFCRADILRASGMEECAWLKYHTDIVGLRNKFLVHFDMDDLAGFIPSLQPALKTAMAYRNWLVTLLQAAIEQGQPLLIAFPTTEELLNEIGEEFDPAA